MQHRTSDPTPTPFVDGAAAVVVAIILIMGAPTLIAWAVITHDWFTHLGRLS